MRQAPWWLSERTALPYSAAWPWFGSLLRLRRATYNSACAFNSCLNRSHRSISCVSLQAPQILLNRHSVLHTYVTYGMLMISPVVLVSPYIPQKCPPYLLLLGFWNRLLPFYLLSFTLRRRRQCSPLFFKSLCQPQMIFIFSSIAGLQCLVNFLMYSKETQSTCIYTFFFSRYHVPS